MSKGQENILRYGSGFVAMKLKKRFLKVPGEKSSECLKNGDGWSRIIIL